MSVLLSKKGYTLIELLAVIAIIVIIASFTFSVFAELKRVSDNRVDQSRVVIYNKAFEDFRFTDYSTLQSTAKDKVIIAQGGKVKVNQYLNLSSEDVEALSNSGKGKYPQSKRECVAAIRAYCGTNDILPSPSVGPSYSYFYHIPEGKCYVKAVDEVDLHDTEWVNLNEYYILITNYILGDVNGDKTISSDDVDIIAQYVAGVYSFSDPYHFFCADLDNNGEVNSIDTSILAQYVSNPNNTDKPEWP
jgi:prepilin-type N-terminal cleavage/methylation domain-containing protein